MFLVGKLGWAVLQPGNLLVLVLTSGFLLLFFSRGQRGPALIGLATLGFLVLAVAPLGSALLLELEQRFPRPVALPGRIDGVIVLGGAVDPGPSMYYGETIFTGSVTRILGAIALARHHPEAKLVLSGGEDDVSPLGYPEARATLGFVLDEGIARDRVILEERSRNTHENAVFAKALIRPKPGEIWVLITSAYHMPRAVGSFRAIGWRVIPYPVDFKIDPITGLRPNFNLLDGLSTQRRSLERSGLASRSTGSSVGREHCFQDPNRTDFSSAQTGCPKPAGVSATMHNRARSHLWGCKRGWDEAGVKCRAAPPATRLTAAATAIPPSRSLDLDIDLLASGGRDIDELVDVAPLRVDGDLVVGRRHIVVDRYARLRKPDDLAVEAEIRRREAHVRLVVAVDPNARISGGRGGDGGRYRGGPSRQQLQTAEQYGHGS